MNAPRSLWLFFILVFCWTWSFWIAAAALEISVQTAAGQGLLRLGLLGPMLGGIGFACFAHDKSYRRDYWLRLVDARRIPAGWYLVVVLFVPALIAVAALLDVASGGTVTLELIGKRVVPLLAAPATVLAFAFGVFVNGPFPEELGWRGYALDQLQARWNALVSSLVLGIVWALWHLPLFFMPGMLHADRGVGSAWFWLFMATVVATAVIYTWIFNNTRRSTLAAILLHFTSNLAYAIANVTDGTNLYATLLWIVAATVVVAFWGAGTLTRGDAAPAR
jgi:membrane protease YdiL (CAAX protease family)